MVLRFRVLRLAGGATSSGARSMDPPPSQMIPIGYTIDVIDLDATPNHTSSVLH